MWSSSLMSFNVNKYVYFDLYEYYLIWYNIIYNIELSYLFCVTGENSFYCFSNCILYNYYAKLLLYNFDKWFAFHVKKSYILWSFTQDKTEENNTWLQFLKGREREREGKEPRTFHCLKSSKLLISFFFD